MSATQQSDRTDNDPSGAATQRFRAPTVEEALQRARELLGDDAEIIEANRIRRGGIGGFFATELGVEVLAQSPTSRAPDTSASTAPQRGDEYDVRPRRTAVTAPAPATDLAASPTRGRAAWRAATTTSGRPLGEEQLAAPLLAALIEQASTEEQRDRPAQSGDRPARVFRPWKIATSDASADVERMTADLVGDAPTARSTAVDHTTTIEHDIAHSSDGAGTGTFAEHFLRELMSDAEALRTKPGRNRALPEARPDALPGLAEEDEPRAPVVVPRRRQASSTRSAPKRRRTSEPELPLMPAATPVEPPVEPPAPLAPATVDAVGPTAALAAIVDQCVQLAAAGDRSTAPTKVALSMTMADGAVVKLTVDLPRSR